MKIFTCQSCQRRYRLCLNSVEHGVCNWAVPVDNDDPLCCACSLNAVIPNLSEPDALQRWQRLETAKPRMLYTRLQLGGASLGTVAVGRLDFDDLVSAWYPLTIVRSTA